MSNLHPLSISELQHQALLAHERLRDLFRLLEVQIDARRKLALSRGKHHRSLFAKRARQIERQKLAQR